MACVFFTHVLPAVVDLCSVLAKHELCYFYNGTWTRWWHLACLWCDANRCEMWERENVCAQRKGVCVCVCVHAPALISMHACVHSWMCACVHVYVCACVCMCACMCTCTCECICECVCMYACVPENLLASLDKYWKNHNSKL